MMNNDHNHDARTSCEETFTEDMGPADWANEPEQPKKPFYADAKAEFGDGQCEDAPCCGCCGGDMSDGYGSPADDAWHDANEYPDW